MLGNRVHIFKSVPVLFSKPLISHYLVTQEEDDNYDDDDDDNLVYIMPMSGLGILSTRHHLTLK